MRPLKTLEDSQPSIPSQWLSPGGPSSDRNQVPDIKRIVISGDVETIKQLLGPDPIKPFKTLKTFSEFSKIFRMKHTLFLFYFKHQMKI